MILIKKAGKQYSDSATLLLNKLWPDHEFEELKGELSYCFDAKDAAIYLAFDQDTVVGVAECGLRRDYVEGTDSSPVGYLEGIYVEEGYRHQGVAKQLCQACENWAKEIGCQEFASDCILSNTESLRFHLKIGFEEVNRIICFAKKL